MPVDRFALAIYQFFHLFADSRLVFNSALTLSSLSIWFVDGMRKLSHLGNDGKNVTIDARRNSLSPRVAEKWWNSIASFADDDHQLNTFGRNSQVLLWRIGRPSDRINRWDARNKDSRSVRYVLAKSGENKNLNNICSRSSVGYWCERLRWCGRPAVPILCVHVELMKFYSPSGTIENDT